jgi:hypothetical protein
MNHQSYPSTSSGQGPGFDEQRAAEELDALLTARLAAQDVPLSADVPPQEAAFAGDLVELAEAMRPDPAFLSDLGARLERTPPRQYPHARWSLLQNLNLRRRPAIIKRTAVTLVGAAVLALLVFLALPLIAPPPDLPSLPSLAALSAYAQGGGTSASGVFPGTNFVLSTTLPSSPARVTVYRQPELKPLTVAEVQRWAERFGMQGPVYRQRVQPNSDATWRATVFDGSRQLTVTSGNWVNYADANLRNSFDSAPAMPFQAVTDSAAGFLKVHGLLDFPYRAEAVPNVKNMVRFTRLLDGKPVENAYAQVAVMPNGQVASVEYHPLQLDPASEYPMRSAQVAWEELTSGQLSSQMQYSIHRDTPSSPPTPSVKFWQPQYRPGQRADLYGRVTVYDPAEGRGARLILLNQFILRGNVQGIENATDSLHIWGVLQTDGKSLDVTHWEKDPAPLFSPFQGTIKRERNLVLLRRTDGKTFLLPNMPDDLPDGIAVSGGGRETNRTEGNYPVLDWTSVMSPPNALPTSSQFDSVRIIQGNTTVMVPAPTRPPSAMPPLAPGQRVEGLEGWLQAYFLESADGKTRTLEATLAQMPLSTEPGWTAGLIGPGRDGIGQYDRLRVRVWGRFSIQDERLTITVERYQKVAPSDRVQAWLGREETATVDGREVVLLLTREGRRYVLATSIRASNPPPMTGEQLVIEGVLRSEAFGGYPVLENFGVQLDDRTRAMTDLKGYQLEPRPPVIRQRQPIPGKAYVESVELIYYAISNPLMGFSYKPMPDQSLRVVQPLWKFSGHTEGGASFEILVQAVSSQYVK